MQCRENCGACCVAPSIHGPIPGMPEGKPAGVRCVQLDSSNLCILFSLKNRPLVCESFKPELSVCGSNRAQAMELISIMEVATSPSLNG